MHVRVCLALLIALTARPLAAQHVDGDLVMAGLKAGDPAATARHVACLLALCLALLGLSARAFRKTIS